MTPDKPIAAHIDISAGDDRFTEFVREAVHDRVASVADTPTTVWAVTSGEYSDFHVRGIFRDEQTANKARQAGFGEDVQEYDLYQPDETPLHITYWHMRGEIDAETAEAFILIWDSEARRYKRSPIGEQRALTTDEWLHPRNPLAAQQVETTLQEHKMYERKHWMVHVKATTEERARKVFFDLVAKTRAEIVEGHR